MFLVFSLLNRHTTGVVESMSTGVVTQSVMCDKLSSCLCNVLTTGRMAIC